MPAYPNVATRGNSTVIAFWWNKNCNLWWWWTWQQYCWKMVLLVDLVVVQCYSWWIWWYGSPEIHTQESWWQMEIIMVVMLMALRWWRRWWCRWCWRMVLNLRGDGGLGVQLPATFRNPSSNPLGAPGPGGRSC